jgi:hypothetical protein
LKATGSENTGVTWYTVYDVRNHMFNNWKPTLVSGCWMPIFLYLLWLPPRWLQRALTRSSSLRARTSIVKYVIPALMVFLLALCAIAEYDDRRLAERISAGDVTTIEGQIEHFVPQRSRDDGPEMFDVNGVHFSYSGGARHFAWVHYKGGPIAEGEYVRVGYIGNDILRLEIAEP